MFDTPGMMACNCREDNSSPSLCANSLSCLDQVLIRVGGHCGVYTLNCCHGVIVCCCKNMAQDKMGVINQREIQRKPRHLPSKWQTLMLSQFPAGMTYFSYNVEINLGLPALLLFIRQIEAKRKKKTHHLQFAFIILMSLKLIGSRDWSFCQKMPRLVRYSLSQCFQTWVHETEQLDSLFLHRKRRSSKNYFYSLS